MTNNDPITSLETDTRTMHDGPQDPPESCFSRFHPLTPLITGWKTIAVLFAIVTFQGIDGIIDAFQSGYVNLHNVSIGAAVAVGVLVLGIGVSALIWRATAYAVTRDGVFVRVKFISTSRRVAPRERIDSVSIERPLLARLCGLAKVRVELAGGGDSHIDLSYLSKTQAEDIHSHVLELTRFHAPERTELPGESSEDAPRDNANREVDAEDKAGIEESASTPEYGPDAAVLTQVPSAVQKYEERIRSVAFDGDGDGHELARIPTTRVLQSMLRDADLWVMFALTLVIGLPWLVWQVIDDFSMNASSLLAALPALLAAPRWIFNRIESGWGFVSRATESGMRARRGLLNTRSDNLSAFRIQSVLLRRPLLWREPGWTEVKVKTAGMEETEDSSADVVLPVGTAEETIATLRHLLPPMGALSTHPIMHPPRFAHVPGAPTDPALLKETDLLRAYLTSPVEQLPGARQTHWSTPIARRCNIAALTTTAVLIRDGLLSRKLSVIPRERVQNVRVTRGPLERRWGLASVKIQIAGDEFVLDGLNETDAMEFFVTLSQDAGMGRRYCEQHLWAVPRLGRLRDREAAPVI